MSTYSYLVTDIKNTAENDSTEFTDQIPYFINKSELQLTKDLDDFAEKRIKSFGAVPSFKGYHGFPSSICSSINNEVVHGIPSKNKIIKVGK